jgi:hypothetical protein
MKVYRLLSREQENLIEEFKLCSLPPFLLTALSPGREKGEEKGTAK